MKIWGILCLLGFINCANAHKVERSDTQDVRTRIGAPHFDEETFQKTSMKDHKGEFPSLSKESSDVSMVSQEEKPEPYMILTTDKVSPPGGGVHALDLKVVSEVVLPLFPEAQTPWWESWWDEFTEWFLANE